MSKGAKESLDQKSKMKCSLVFRGVLSKGTKGRKEERSKYTANQKDDNKNDIYHTMEFVYHTISNACLLCRKMGWVRQVYMTEQRLCSYKVYQLIKSGKGQNQG